MPQLVAFGMLVSVAFVRFGVLDSPLGQLGWSCMSCRIVLLGYFLRLRHVLLVLDGQPIPRTKNSSFHRQLASPGPCPKTVVVACCVAAHALDGSVGRGHCDVIFLAKSIGVRLRLDVLSTEESSAQLLPVGAVRSRWRGSSGASVSRRF